VSGTPISTSVQSVTGGIDDPFDDLEDAITKAYEACSGMLTSCSITIYLFNETHYLLRDNRDYYMPS
jgi:hypothetical protein